MPHYTKDCAAQQSGQFEARYIFPSWFLRYCVDICVRKAPTGPSVGLVVKHRIEYAHTNIFHAVNVGDTKRVRQYLERHPSVANSLEYADGRTPLSVAVELHAITKVGVAECVRLLLQAGADADAESDGGETARQVAATNVMINGYPPSVCREIEELLSTTQCVEDMDMTHLSQVTLGRRVGDVRSLAHVLTSRDASALDRNDGFGLGAIHYAVMVANFGGLRDLVEAGADVNLRTLPHKLTPLYLTAMYDSSTSDQMARFLLARGADPKFTTDEGFYPAQVACVVDRLDLIAAILESGFDVDTQTADNRTCLHTAARFDRPITTKYLLERGASLQIADSKGSLPLMDAVTYNSHEALPLLLNHDSTHLHLVVDQAANTVLHRAATSGDAQTMAIRGLHGLYGLDTAKRNIQGRTAAEAFLLSFRFVKRVGRCFWGVSSGCRERHYDPKGVPPA